ncbi:uncharacterized protein BDZ83DRAFT_374007 [Colletotrichum acutatum]|uniref:Uncharacterized protein n=1 Tax=Glomerella acutata TaxID=27357 RepID=A0AAD8XNH2_GLOAC|nr:uncharacterized protein BDZ83DRAFT_374007 [Colletotrichum acutatum]KAK1730533.1 hypothetical protein BDZ83DRAFT_374007 [Colletotrichum acutatum]
MRWWLSAEGKTNVGTGSPSQLSPNRDIGWARPHDAIPFFSSPSPTLFYLQIWYTHFSHHSSVCLGTQLDSQQSGIPFWGIRAVLSTCKGFSIHVLRSCADFVLPPWPRQIRRNGVQHKAAASSWHRAGETGVTQAVAARECAIAQKVLRARTEAGMRVCNGPRPQDRNPCCWPHLDHIFLSSDYSPGSMIPFTRGRERD